MTGAAFVQGARSAGRESADGPGRRASAGVLLAVFAAVLVCVGPRHEPWFDEAQAWLIARDADPWTIVSSLARYEGTPALWHLLLAAAQRLGLGYDGLWQVSATCACIGAALVLFASPLPLWVRAGVVFGYAFAYQYALVARSYALDLALVPLAATLFAGRLRRPLAYGLTLGLLANSNAYGFVFVGVVALDFSVAAVHGPGSPRDRTRRLAGVAVVGLLAAIAVAQAWPVQDPDAQICCGVLLDPLRPIILLTEALQDPGLYSVAGSGAAGLVAVLLACGALASTAPLMIAAGQGRMAAALLGALLALTGLVGHFVHSALIWLALLFLVWIGWSAVPKMSAPARRALFAGLALTLITQDIDAGAALWRDTVEPYSAGRAAARLIIDARRLYPTRSIALLGLKAFAVQPYLPRGAVADAAPAKGYWIWRRSFPAPAAPESARSAAMEVSGRYDLLMVSDDVDLDMSRLARRACRLAAALPDYRLIAIFPGALIWKTRRLQGDGLMVLGRADASWSKLGRAQPTC